MLLAYSYNHPLTPIQRLLPPPLINYGEGRCRQRATPNRFTPLLIRYDHSTPMSPIHSVPSTSYSQSTTLPCGLVTVMAATQAARGIATCQGAPGLLPLGLARVQHRIPLFQRPDITCNSLSHTQGTRIMGAKITLLVSVGCCP